MSRLESESHLLWQILEWSWTPLLVAVGWLLRKVLFLDASLRVLQAESTIRQDLYAQSYDTLVREINGHGVALKEHNDGVVSRLNSIDEHLRNGSRPK